MDDLGVPLFLETPISGHVHFCQYVLFPQNPQKIATPKVHIYADMINWCNYEVLRVVFSNNPTKTFRFWGTFLVYFYFLKEINPQGVQIEVVNQAWASRNLVGGRTNPSEIDSSKWESSPNFRGENSQHF